MMKRIVALFLCVLWGFSLVACGGSSEPIQSSALSDTGSFSSSDLQAETEVSSDEGSEPDVTDGAEEEVLSTDTTEAVSSDSRSDSATDSSTDTGVDSEEGSDTEDESEQPTTETSPIVEPDVVVYDVFEETLSHKLIATDIINFSLVVLDLNYCNGDFSKLTEEGAVVWEWKSREDENCHYANKIIRSISGVKFRYSEYYKRDVVIACANFGWVGVIDYATCRLLWECELPVGPHSVEMLPNGDVVIGSAEGDGALFYVPLSAGEETVTHSVVSPSCHGVCWDPEKEWLWVLEKDGVVAFRVDQAGTAGGTLVRLEDHGAAFSGDSGGHAFAPIAGEPGKYWVSAGKLWIFDSKAETLTAPSPTELSAWAIKGICSFSDGTVIESIAGFCKNNTYSWGSDGLRIMTREPSAEEGGAPRNVETVVPFTEREFYKIQAFTKRYQ